MNTLSGIHIGLTVAYKIIQAGGNLEHLREARNTIEEEIKLMLQIQKEDNARV